MTEKSIFTRTGIIVDKSNGKKSLTPSEYPEYEIFKELKNEINMLEFKPRLSDFISNLINSIKFSKKKSD